FDRSDHITDFEIGVDLIDFSILFDLNRYGSANPFDDYIRVVQGRGRTNIQIDLNGDFGRRDRFRTFASLAGITASDVTIDSFVL
ncbi:MAG: type I secretion C-terminal target domain-containing protein, partial [Cyanobacteria bacterium P01_F01_bin.4]